jgi:hypothetical protein
MGPKESPGVWCPSPDAEVILEVTVRDMEDLVVWFLVERAVSKSANKWLGYGV